ncbi:MAG: gamma-glutamylcyclotransferase [Gemmataceae bacterium]|nr:gamma-glutamylcyclotransferase [Gemmataceae bacterium]
MAELMKNYLFLYGTLLPEHVSPDLKSVVQRLRRLGSATIAGRLFDLGEYPALVLDTSAETRVTGEVFELPDDPGVLQSLDAYEEFDPNDPDGSLFLRKRMPIELRDGRRILAWVYIYNRDPSHSPLVSGGNYSEWKAASHTARRWDE